MKQMAELALSDVMSRQIQTVAPDCTLQEAARRMAEARVSCLLVEKGGLPLGILTERDIVRLVHRQTPTSEQVSAAMSSPVLTAPGEMPLRDAIQILAERHIRHLVVVDNTGKTAGIISETDCRIHLGLDVFRRIRNLSALMDREVPCLPPEAPLAAALQHMVDRNWDYVIVTTDNRPVGILTERDIPRLLSSHPLPGTVSLGQTMSHPVHSVLVTASITDALERMDALHLRHMAVVDAEGQIIGVVSQHRLLERLSIELLEDTLARQSHAYELAAAFRASPAATSISRLSDGMFVEVNERYARMFDWKREEIIGRTAVGIGLWGEQERQRWLEKLAQTGHLDDYETTFSTRHGEARQVSISAEHIELHGELYVLAFILDTSVRHRNEQALRRDNRALTLLREATRSANRCGSEAELLTHFCNLLIELGDYRLAWVGFAEKDENGSISPVAEAGFDDHYLSTLNLSWKDTVHGQGPTGRAIRSGMPVACQHIDSDPDFAPWREQARRHGFKSSIAFPLRVDGSVVGALNLYSAQPEAFDDSEIALLDDLANELATGLARLRAQVSQAHSRAGSRCSAPSSSRPTTVLF